jgi:hypothetical protein
MTIPDYTLLTVELEKNEQMCTSLKALIDFGCSRETLSVIAEELCEQTEIMKNRYGIFT